MHFAMFVVGDVEVFGPRIELEQVKHEMVWSGTQAGEAKTRKVEEQVRQSRRGNRGQVVDGRRKWVLSAKLALCLLAKLHKT